MKQRILLWLFALTVTSSLAKADNNNKTASTRVNTSSPLCTFSTSSTSTPYYCSAAPGTGVENPIGGTPPYTYLWLPSGNTNATLTGLTAGTYTVTVYDQAGCTATDSVIITTASYSLILAAAQDTILVGGQTLVTATGGVSYTWSPSTGLTCTNCANPVASPVVTTTYTVVETNPCGSITDSITIYVTPFCVNYFNEPICIATIDTSTNLAELIWGRTNSPPQGGTGWYNIYRDSTLGYAITHTQPLNVLSEFIDPNSNPSAGPVSYELSTYDSCGESALSLPHTTIFLITTSALNVYILNWTAYVGFTPTLYRIFRGPALNAMVQIDSVPNTVLTYHDTLPPLGSYYAIEAVSPTGVCIPTAHVVGHQATATSLSGSFSNGFNTGILTGTNILSVSPQARVYPNPGNGSFNFVIAKGTKLSAARIEIYNVLGQIVEVQNFASPQTKINLGSKQDGIYFYKVIGESGEMYGKGKLVIER